VTIAEQAQEWFGDNESEGGFAVALMRCFLFGIVIKRPDFVLLAEEVLTDGKSIVAMGGDCPKNCWWLWFCATPKDDLTAYDWMLEAPYPHHFVGFKRRGKIKIYTWERIGKDINYGRSPICSSTTTS
jgi:hypothetical protein